ncbi:MAG: hypothetical protein ACLQT7_06985 [Candidatus Dormibacteria bacterium]
MSATPVSERRRRRLVLKRPGPAGVLLALAVVLLVLVIVPLGAAGGSVIPSILPTLGYLLLVCVTWGVVAGVRREPGSWLGRRTVRRGVVAAIAADCVGVVATSSPGAQIGSATVLLLLFLVLLNIALGRATERMATAPDGSVDERQEALRNRAHHLAYAVFAVIVGALLLAVVVSAQSRTWTEHALGSGGLLVFLELIFVLPGMVLAVIEPAPPPPEPDSPPRPRAASLQARAAAALVVLVFALPFLASVGVVVLPLHNSAVSDISPPATPAPGGQQVASPACGTFMTRVYAGWVVDAELPVFASACWDGSRAHEPSGSSSTYSPDCWSASVLVAVTSAQCTPITTTGVGGTYTLTWRATVSPELLPFLSRRVDVEVIVDRNGHVEIHT